MVARIALCIEEEACRNPGIVGLEGEALDSQPWLDVYTSGEEARKGLARDEAAQEFWVVSCGDVEPINLAASIKVDHPALPVRLVTSEPCGSLFSRAHAANIDEVMEFSGFLACYAKAKGETTVTGIAPADDASGKAEGQARKAAHALRKKAKSAEKSDPASEQEPRQVPHGGDEDRIAAQAEPALKEAVQAAPPIELVVADSELASPIARYLKYEPNAALTTTAGENRALVLTVVSGSGGAGKSAVSALSALIAQNWGYKTLLLDCDLQFGDVASMVGVDEALCVDEALQHPEKLEAVLAQASTFAVLAAPTRLEASEEVARQLPALLERVSQAFDVVVVNTGATWAEQHAVLLERSSVALFLIDQRVSSVRACRHALELCARCGIAATPFQYALNRCAKGAPLSPLDVSSALQGAPVFELKDGGRDVEDYLSGGAAADLIAIKNEFSKSLEKAMERILPGGIRVLCEAASSSDDRRPPRRRARWTVGKRGRRQ